MNLNHSFKVILRGCGPIKAENTARVTDHSLERVISALQEVQIKVAKTDCEIEVCYSIRGIDYTSRLPASEISQLPVVGYVLRTNENHVITITNYDDASRQGEESRRPVLYKAGVACTLSWSGEGSEFLEELEKMTKAEITITNLYHKIPRKVRDAMIIGMRRKIEALQEEG